jgi:hypothetical protein
MRRLLALLLLSACAGPETATVSDELAERPSCAPVGPWEKLGALPLPGPLATGDGALAPSALDDGGVLHLWYAEKSGTHYALKHTTSRDGGDTFALPETVTGLGEGYLHAYPSVWREDGAFRMAFGSGSIKLATSADGVRFTIVTTSLLRASFEADRFDALSVLYPSRVVDGVLFFSGYDGRRIRIGRAVAQDDGTFAVDPPRAVIEPGEAFDNTSVAQPHVVRTRGEYWMLYGGYDTSATSPGPYRIGAASSVDGISWTKKGVVLDLSPNGTDAWSTRDPSLVASKAGWLMFYAGLGDDGRYRIHRARLACGT